MPSNCVKTRLMEFAAAKQTEAAKLEAQAKRARALGEAAQALSDEIKYRRETCPHCHGTGGEDRRDCEERNFYWTPCPYCTEEP